MLELISMVAGLIVCIMIPIEVGKIRKGWVRDKFKGDRPKFLAAYRKQLKMLMWLGWCSAWWRSAWRRLKPETAK